jgi:hypothetical protein
MPSITTWTRLEPRAREDDIRVGLRAQLYDPLWLLGRQWQIGEFKGEDAGSPVISRVEADAFALTRYLPQPLGPSGRATGQPLDSRTTPLETIVEREPVARAAPVDLRLAADAGQHFRRLLIANGLGQHVPAYLAQYGLQPPTPEQRAAFDEPSLRFLGVMAGRTIDGARLFEGLRVGQFPNPGLPGLTADPAIPAADRERALTVAQRWLGWYQSLLSEPADGASPWVQERMEYEFAVSAATPTGEVVLSAPEYVEGHLDWFDFSLRPGASLGSAASEARREDVRQAVIPAPVSFPGMPANRWWEFEDRQIDFGSVAVAPDDLISLVLVEFALIYGNDWFILPLELAVGSLCRVRSLTITDSFGDQVAVPPMTPPSAPAGAWQMFSLAIDPRHGVVGQVPRGFLFLPPALGPSLHGPPVEEVWLLRDEMANLAWGVERVVESRIGERIDRRETYYRRRENAPAPGPSGAQVTYRLATEVPDYWVPLVPVAQPGGRGIRLQRGALARPGPAGPARAIGRILGSTGPLLLFDEEVPRSGARVTASYQYARWIDGSTHVWRGRRKEAGRGEGSSGLRYDAVT